MAKTMHTSSDSTSRSFYPATNLFIYPSVWKGIARIADLWGNLDEYRYSPSEEIADIKALAHDYNIVMKGIAESQRNHERIAEKVKG